MTPETETPHLPWESMTDMSVMRQSPLIMRRDNQVQATGDDDAAKEIVPE